MHQKYPTYKPFRILISGSSGLVGKNLTSFLTSAGHSVDRMLRSVHPSKEGTPAWDPRNGIITSEHLEGYDAIFHLGGANIGSGLWTRRRKQLLYDSRVKSTRLLADTLAKLRNPPKVFLVSSATGFYGDRGSEQLTETDPLGNGFLAKLSRDWEYAAHTAQVTGIRVVHLRFGLVLSPLGGVLKRLLPVFKLGMGAIMGSGDQYWPWITLADGIGAMNHAMYTEQISGPLNVVAPQEVTNREFTKTLNAVLRRPTILKIPAWVLRLTPGDMGQEAFLASTRVIPDQLNKFGFTFQLPELKPALEFMLRN
jgi:uncharacterized protein (TIGR01777 family)